MLNFNNKESNVSIVDSFFYSNLADMIGCIYAYHKKGLVYIRNNTFIENYAITEKRRLIGSASVIQISGIFAFVQSYRNFFYYNRAEYSAIIGVYYGYFEDQNSLFYGKNF